MVGYEEGRGAFLKRMLERPQSSPHKEGRLWMVHSRSVSQSQPNYVGEADHGLWTAWVTVTGPCSRSGQIGPRVLLDQFDSILTSAEERA